MKILRCHIENFGILSNFDYDFTDGLNTIKEDNGFGKTTFASFIKAMFYGLESKKSTKVLIDRKKYEPWQGGAFGGNIEFEINDKKYKIERFFGKKETEDTFKIYDLSTNLESKDYSENIGEEIFRINKEAYERSTFISGQNIETSMNDSINTKLGNLLESENDINTSEQAIRILDEAIKTYKKTGERGEIDLKIKEKTNLEQKIEESKVDQKALEERKKQNNDINSKIKAKQEEQEELKKELTAVMEREARKAKRENYEIYKNNTNESKEKLEKCGKFFEDNIPEDGEVEKLMDNCLSLEKCKTEVKNYDVSWKDRSEMEHLNKMFKGEEISEEIINSKISKYNNLNEIKNDINLNEEKKISLNREKEIFDKQKRRGGLINLLICLISVIFICGAIGLYFLNYTKFALYSLIVGVVGLAIFALKIVLLRKRTARGVEVDNELEKINQMQENLREDELFIKKDVEGFIDQFSEDEFEPDAIIQLTEIKTRYIRYKDLKNSINTAFDKQNEVVKKMEDLEKEITKELSKYFNKMTKSYMTYAQEVQIKKNEYNKQKEDYEEKLKAQEDYKKENNIDEIEKLAKESPEEENLKNEDIEAIKKDIQNKIDLLSEEINKLNDDKSYNKSQMEILENKLDEVSDVERDIQQIDLEISEMNESCSILEKTKKYLETAKEQFSSHYLGGMQKSFMEKFKLISGKEMDIELDVNLDVKVNEQGSGKEIRYFSTGYKDLIYICMRLSLIDSLFEGEKPFVILDDPFVNLDKSKIQNALKLLKNISKEYQIIYFICHESRK